MGLPVITQSAPYSFEDGTTIEVKALSRGDCMKMWALDGGNAAQEPYAIHRATGIPIDEAEEWYNNTPFDEVEKLLNHILAVSGLVEDTQKK
jgi:hypothetical protein